MGGITPLITTALPLAGSVAGAVRSLDRTGSSGGLAAIDRKAQLDAEAQARQWAHDEQIRQQEAELKRRQAEADRIAAEQARAREMESYRAAQDQALAQLRAGRDADTQAQDQQAQSQLAQMTATADAEERRRVDALRRAVARTRAGLGSRGVGMADGSGEAILLGLVGDTAADRQDAQAVDRLKRQAVQQNLDALKRRNLLDLAQLADRQRLEFMSKFF